MSGGNVFNPKLVFGLIAAGIVAFGALLLLLAFGTTPSVGREGRGHALSVAATGFRGLVDLVGEFRSTATIQGPEDFGVEELVVVAVEPQTHPADVARLMEQRHGRPTLIILPKWITIAEPTRRGWVRALGPGAGVRTSEQLGRRIDLNIARAAKSGPAHGENILDGMEMPAPDTPQVIEGPDLTPVMVLPGGGTLVAQMGDQPHYLVADPDLLNNYGLREPARARAALQLIDSLNSTDAEYVAFDLTVNGIDTRQDRPSLLRFAFEPPFLAMTLALAIAALLAGLHGAVRFGAALREERAIALGKATLVENSAGLIRLAGRETRLGATYAEVIRQETARAVAAPPLQTDALDAYLDRLGRPGAPRFSELAANLYLARDRASLIAAARALFQWKKDIIR